MSDLTLKRDERGASGPSHRPPTPSPPDPLWRTPQFRRVEDQRFLMMERAYSRSGGIASGDEVARLLRRRSEQPISKLARWIVARVVVNFEWQSQTLLPLFQFDLSDMSLHPGTVQVIEELSDVFDDWDLASWFASPNSWLQDATPAEAIRHSQPSVLRAARADRFIAHG